MSEESPPVAAQMKSESQILPFVGALYPKGSDDVCTPTRETVEPLTHPW